MEFRPAREDFADLAVACVKVVDEVLDASFFGNIVVFPNDFRARVSFLGGVDEFCGWGSIKECAVPFVNDARFAEFEKEFAVYKDVVA